MLKAELYSNYFFNSFRHNQAEQIKKESNFCPDFVRNTPD